MDTQWGGVPFIEETTSGNRLLYRLNMSSHRIIIYDTNRSNVGFCIDFIESKVKDEEIITKVEQLTKMNKDNYRKTSDLMHQMKEVISIIELGHNIKGKCKSCPKLLRIF